MATQDGSASTPLDSARLSVAACEERGRIRPGHDVGDAGTRADQAITLEQHQALRVGFCIAPLVFVLTLVALSSPLWPEGHYHDYELDVETWIRGLLSIFLLLISVQLISIVTALEHLVGDGTESRHALRVVLVWMGRGVVLICIVLAVCVNWRRPFEVGGVDDRSWMPEWLPDLWEDLGRWELVVPVMLVSQFVTLLCLTAFRLVARTKRGDLEQLTPGKSREVVSMRSSTCPPDTLLAIGASGGGIRAAAFVLGGYQAVQDRARAQSTRGEEPPEPHLFAVSGGSYVAAALALRRTYASDGTHRTLTGSEESTSSSDGSWTGSYTLESPEMERLRRHTRYLFEPGWATRDGAVSLLMGAALNLFLLGAAIRLVSWLSAELALITNVVEPTRNGEGERVELTLAPGWETHIWAYLLLPTICAFLIGLYLTLRTWRVASAFDPAKPPSGASPPVGEPEGRTWYGRQRRSQEARAIGFMRWAAWWRPAIFGAALAWFVLVLGVPAATVGVVHLTTTNTPNTTVASALNAVGFGTDELCADALVDQLRAASAQASLQGRISPDEQRDVSAGACGVEVTVSRTVLSGGNVDPADDIRLALDEEAVAELSRGDRTAVQWAGLSAIFLFVLALLRRGPSPEQSAGENWRRSARRVVLTWLPLVIMVAAIAYLLLLWCFRFMVHLSPAYAMWAAGITAFACALAYGVDANATSLHNFYRSRLSDAFAVGVDGQGGAEELPAKNVYLFSDLAAVRPAEAESAGREEGRADPRIAKPRLHIIATVNSRAANEAPTMRGGFPLVFGPEQVLLYREQRQRVTVPTRDYENFAGPGRVSIMAAVAISGAAISPLMGRYGVQMASYRLLMALFNIRVGTWVLNPMHTKQPSSEATFNPDRPRRFMDFLWVTRRPGLAQIAFEAVGSASADRRWVYLSDGGHLDNTGLVEAVRHCVEEQLEGRVLVLDASNDPPGSWSALGDAVAVVRADLGVDLRTVTSTTTPPWMRVLRGSGLEVIVVKAIRVEDDPKDPDASGWADQLPPNVVSFQATHKDFPRAPTSRQRFGDLEFEAYRSLGYAMTSTAFTAVDAERSAATATADHPAAQPAAAPAAAGSTAGLSPYARITGLTRATARWLWRLGEGRRRTS